MDLGPASSSTAALLSSLSDVVRGRQDLLIEEWRGIVAWAGQNLVSCPEGAATLGEGFLDTGVPVAGDGGPLVSEFALMELVAVLGRSPDGGRVYVGRVLSCAWRLPRLFAAVVSGSVASWRAERVAEVTMSLRLDAAGFVDRHLAAAVGGVGGVSWAQVERLVAEAVVRFDPVRAEAERLVAADRRRFDIGDPTEHGLVYVDGVLDAADARDLDMAVAREAELLARLGDASSVDVRRSKAAGALARRDLALDLLVADEETGEVLAPAPGRRVTLNVHVTDTTLTDTTPAGINPVARWEEGRCPVSAEQVREWLAVTGTTVTVRPVIDLADCVPVTAYEVPDRHRVRVGLRDHTCRFPHCTRPASACDLDHAVPHARGGPTCPCNLVPLCRRHHRAKTHSRWRYETVSPGRYRWTTPHGHVFDVGPTGTHPVGAHPVGASPPLVAAVPDR